jgi:hypothetical protein
MKNSSSDAEAEGWGLMRRAIGEGEHARKPSWSRGGCQARQARQKDTHVRKRPPRDGQSQPSVPDMLEHEHGVACIDRKTSIEQGTW